MAYQESTISAITDIPALVATFAASHGWTVTGSGSAPILTRSGGGMSFQLTASISGSDHSLALTENGGSVATSNARVVSPKLNGSSGAPAVSLPSKVYLFANSTPQPFMAIVIEYGFNSYRHLYLGNLVKTASFTGGEVISGAQPYNTNDSFQFPINYQTAQYLFASIESGVAQGNSGGVNVNHVNNAHQWRQFYATASWPYFGNMLGTEAIGGFNDDVNDGYMARGRSSFAGVQILSPIALYASVPVTGDTLFAPLGYPAGIRSIHMQDVEPAAEFTIGSQTWKAFPVFAKSDEQSVAQGGSGWGASETSYYVGYAYPKN